MIWKQAGGFSSHAGHHVSPQGGASPCPMRAVTFSTPTVYTGSVQVVSRACLLVLQFTVALGVWNHAPALVLILGCLSHFLTPLRGPFLLQARGTASFTGCCFNLPPSGFLQTFLSLGGQAFTLDQGFSPPPSDLARPLYYNSSFNTLDFVILQRQMGECLILCSYYLLAKSIVLPIHWLRAL